MILKITNGEVKIKEFCSRKTKKAINSALYSEVDIKIAGEKGGATFNGFKLSAIEKANDVALIEMVESLTINNENLPINTETFDNLPADDVELIIAEINKITAKQLPNA